MLDSHTGAGGHAALITDLHERLRVALDSVLPSGTRAALLNFPNHENVGDAALWLGGRRLLVRCGVRIVYECEPRTYSRAALAAAVGGGATIVLNGGGNFGDLWPGQQQVREQVLADFPRARIVQLPQSICFEEARNLERVRRLCEAAADFTLLVRDRQSLELAQAHFDVPVLLCPDAAFGVGALPRPHPPRSAILWLARADKESAGGTVPAAAADLEVTDWMVRSEAEAAADAGGSALRRANAALVAELAGDPAAAAARWAALRRTFLPLADARVRRGTALLSRGRVVVTDRLHGHILALLLGIPHVVLDNRYGKVRSCYETWTAASPLASWADSPEEAAATARRLAAANSGAAA